jgi:hypothetical protein
MAGIGTPGKIVDREVIEYRSAWAASAPRGKGTHPAINKTLAPAQKETTNKKSPGAPRR